jgi:hypothetical protein
LHQAFFSGAISPEGAKPLDRHWRRKLRWAMESVEKDNNQKLAAAQHDLCCGAITYTAGQKVFQTYWDQAIALQERMREWLFPWQEQERRGVYRSMTEQWERTYGRMDDPETQQKIDRAVEQMRNRSKSGRQQQRA